MGLTPQECAAGSPGAVLGALDGFAGLGADLVAQPPSAEHGLHSHGLDASSAGRGAPAEVGTHGVVPVGRRGEPRTTPDKGSERDLSDAGTAPLPAPPQGPLVFWIEGLRIETATVALLHVKALHGDRCKVERSAGYWRVARRGVEIARYRVDIVRPGELKLELVSRAEAAGRGGERAARSARRLVLIKWGDRLPFPFPRVWGYVDASGAISRSCGPEFDRLTHYATFGRQAHPPPSLPRAPARPRRASVQIA